MTIDNNVLPCQYFIAEAPLPLDSGATLSPWQLAYQTYGTLNAKRNNAILICHATTGDQFVADQHPITGKEGWWSNLVGKGKPIDTERYFVICSNILGGCMGSTGPSSLNPNTGEPYGLSFPVITIADMVRAQSKLIEHLGIEQLFCVVGASMGGMQALQWAADYPQKIFAVMPIATACRHSAQNMGFHEVARQAIMADPDWMEGRYPLLGLKPARGLAVARMATHITYLSESALQRKFGRKLQTDDKLSFSFAADFQIESYLRHQGHSFVARFDANSYLYITRATNYFDLGAEHNGHIAEAFRHCPARFLVVSFSSDWLFPTVESRHMVLALNAAGVDVSFAEIITDKGHDAFLLEEPDFYRVVEGFLERCARDYQLPVTAKKPLQPTNKTALRADLQMLCDFIPEGAKVLDVGCGDGSLLESLIIEKNAQGFGLEISREGVEKALARGLSVIQGDAETDLVTYANQSFDVVVLSKALQSLKNPAMVLAELARIGKTVLVSFSNYGHWRVRLQGWLAGRVPILEGDSGKDDGWWNAPHIRPCSLTDFLMLLEHSGLYCQQVGLLSQKKTTFITAADVPNFVFKRQIERANAFTKQAVFEVRSSA